VASSSVIALPALYARRLELDELSFCLKRWPHWEGLGWRSFPVPALVETAVA
jgi:hypothetical protein